MSKQDFSNWTLIKKSAKEHDCNGCLEVIPKESTYYRIAGVSEGDFYSVKLCLECKNHLSIRREHFEDGWTDGDIGEDRIWLKEREGERE